MKCLLLAFVIHVYKVTLRIAGMFVEQIMQQSPRNTIVLIARIVLDDSALQITICYS